MLVHAMWCVLQALKQRIELGETVEEEDDTMEFQQILETAENSPEVREVLHRIPCSPRVSGYSSW